MNSILIFLLSQARAYSRVAVATLNTLAGYIDWVSLSHITTKNCQVLEMLCLLLSEPELQLEAAECLLIAISRKVSHLENHNCFLSAPRFIIITVCVFRERERGQETGDRSGAIPLMPLNNWCCHHVTLSNNFILFSSNPRHNFRKKVSIVIDCIDSSFWEIDVKILISPFRPFRSHDCLCLMQEKIFILFLSDLFDWLIILVFNHR